MSIKIIVILSAAAVFMAVILYAVIKDEKNRQRNGENTDKWLFSEWDRKIYDAYFKKKPESYARSVGFDIKKYLDDCALIKKEPNTKGCIVQKMFGILFIPVSILTGIITSDFLVMLAGLMFGLLFTTLPGRKESRMAIERKAALKEDLPRFLDLLQAALYINMPIESAIAATAKYMEGSVLSQEFSETIAEVRYGASGWREALERMADRYEIDDFSDFVMNLTISYDKGLNIYKAVMEMSADAKQSRLLDMKERASKLNTGMVIPIVIFKLLPMIIIMALPMIMSLKDSLF